MVRYDLSLRESEVLRYFARNCSDVITRSALRNAERELRFNSKGSLDTQVRNLVRKGYLSRVSAGRFRVAAPMKRVRFHTAEEKLKEDYQLSFQDDTLIAPRSDVDLKKVRPITTLSDTLSTFDAIALSENTHLLSGDSLLLMRHFPQNSIHAIVTDPPYGLIEYDQQNQHKLREGKGGVWRIPPTLNGVTRSPLPRFTVLTTKDRDNLEEFFVQFGKLAIRALVPGGHLLIASNPLLSTSTFSALQDAGFEKRGEFIRLVTTLRGGDRPKGAENEFPGVSVMPRSSWEPWGIFRKPISESTVAANLRKWSTGGLRRVSDAEPFKDVFACGPARGNERRIAPHPSLKPQKLLRHLVRACLPLGKGIILDPFAGSCSTLAAASALALPSIGIEQDAKYLDMAGKAFKALRALP